MTEQRGESTDGLGDSGAVGGPEPAPVKRSALPKVLILAVAAVLLIVFAAWFFGGRATKIEAASEECQKTLAVADGGKTITLHVPGEDGDADLFTRATYDQVSCVLTELGAPSSFRDHLGSTRALDGMQASEWASFSARWTYHPRNGLRLTITER